MVPRPALLIVASLGLAALTLLYPSTPTYDPWAWLVWGREILHLNLSTVAGPSWKPLPVLFTTPFALLGSAAPDMWLVVARAGALAALALAFCVARRLGGVVAGAAAAATLATAPWLIRNSALGNSEGLMAAAVLAALERHLAGKPVQAFGWGVAAALLRPEAWLFLGMYALWLLVVRRGAALKLVIAGIGCLPALWFLPELWGSGDLIRAAERARQPLSNSAAFADDPVAQVLSNAVHIVPVPSWIGLVAVVGFVLVGRKRGRVPFAIIALAVLWVLQVAVMTAHGFSGNQRYLIVPAVLAIVVGAIGAGWALEPLATRGRGAMATVAAVVAVACALPSLGGLGALEQGLRYQGVLTQQLTVAIADAGGAARLRACGKPFTGPFLVPAVAWQLRVHTAAVGLDARPPAVVFRVRGTNGARPLPALRGLGEARQHTLGRAAGWRIVGTC
jgi:hypothetical protein